MSEIEHAMNLLREEYNRLDCSGEIAISPAKLADAVYRILDDKRKAPYEVQALAILELRQLARSICAERNRTEQLAVEAQVNLFDMQLQARYPARRGDDDVYVLRSELTLDERNANIARLRREAEAKNAHADTLQAETNMLIREGKLRAIAPEDSDGTQALN